MAATFPGRFIDREDFKALLEREGFSSRKGAARRLAFLYAFVVITLLLVIATMQFTSRMMLAPLDGTLEIDSANRILLGMKVLLLIFGVTTTFAIHRLRYMLLVAEFQNVVFSNAMAVNTAFCAIVNHDRKIIYTSSDFNRIFRTQYENGLRDLDAVFMNEGLDAADKKRVHDAMSQRISESVVFDVIEDGTVKEKYIIKIEPLERPRGYFVMRAYERN